jgi:DnaJ-domain-containing protein 1
MQSLLFGLALLTLVLLGRHFSRASATIPWQQMRKFGGTAAILLGALMAFKGMISYGMTLASIGSLLLWGSTSAIWQIFKPRGARSADQTSRVQTAHLDMELDHGTGQLRGKVLKGVFKGRQIDRMAPAELALLWQDCRFADPQSAQLLETYLDRIHSTWRDDMARAEATPGAGGIMTKEEALEVLGLKAGATIDEIRAAHRDLMKKLHPDLGGSTYLAAKINEAKDKLLG